MSGHPVWNVQIQNVLNQAPPLLADFMVLFRWMLGCLRPSSYPSHSLVDPVTVRCLSADFQDPGQPPRFAGDVRLPSSLTLCSH